MGTCGAKAKSPKVPPAVSHVVPTLPSGPPTPTTAFERKKALTVPALAIGTSQIYQRRKQRGRSSASSGLDPVTPRTGAP